MSKGIRKRKPQPVRESKDPLSHNGVEALGLPSTINFNEQHVHQHISGDLAATLQVVNQMAPDMRERAMEMAGIEQRHRHEQEEKTNEQFFTLKQEELASNKELQEKHMRNILVTDLVSKLAASIAAIMFIGQSFIWLLRGTTGA